jgi:exodeoxyribonuclease-3
MAGDWNVSQTKLDTYPRLRTEPPHARARAEFDEHRAAAGMIDVFRQRFPEERAYTWFNRRSRAGRLDAARVDFVLVAEELLPRVILATILGTPSDREGSDHAPVVVELAEKHA